MYKRPHVSTDLRCKTIFIARLKILRKRLYDISDLLGSGKLTPKMVKQGFALNIVFEKNAVNPKY